MERKKPDLEATSDQPGTEPAVEASHPDAGGELGELDQLRQELEDAQASAESYLDQLRRSVADFSNYKKRIEREALENQKYASTNFIRKMLPIIDDLDRAIDNVPAELEDHSWVSGVLQIRNKLQELLKQEGVTPVPTDDSFDPKWHEAVTYEESPDHDEGEIIGVLRPGYRMGERVLRPAQVRVARGTSD